MAATQLPAQTEALLLYLLRSHPPGALIGVASVGKVMGSCVNFWLVLNIQSFAHQKSFPIKPEQITKAERYYQS
ncbi:DedA family protein, partial [Moraxella porci]|nr:DedA family protein [Moraxella porci]